MIENPMDVLELFPIRKNKNQKQTFRDAVRAHMEKLGYTVAVEKGSFGAHNVVIGDPESAKYLVTAHYDTPAALLIPNLITPCNPVTFVLYQILVVGLFVIAAMIPGVFLGIILDDPEIGSSFALIFYWVLLIMMLLGPANKCNANDNTSGVVTVLEIAGSLPAELRERVCFVFFDLEEAGLIGSASYAKAHKKQIKEQIILNCDCVGDGDILMIFPNKKTKNDGKQMDALRAICGADGCKSLALREKGFSYYPSDQKNFPYGMGIAAFQNSSWAGLYCDKIHTNKDTVLDKNNVSFLCDRITRLISAD